MNLLDPGLVFRRDIGRFAESMKVAVHSFNEHSMKLISYGVMLLVLSFQSGSGRPTRTPISDLVVLHVAQSTGADGIGFAATLWPRRSV